MLSISNVMPSSLKRAALVGTLLASFSLAAYADTRILTPEQNWMPVTDLTLPRQMKIGVLENGIRFVVMPSRLAKDSLALRFELQTATNQTWRVAHDIDLSQTTLKEALVALRQQLEVDGKIPATPNGRHTLILVGQVEVKEAIEQIDTVFASASIASSAPSSLFQALDSSSEALESSAAKIVVTQSQVMLADDSKMSRKVATQRQLAADVLVARIERQLIEANVAVVAVEAQERWEHQQRISTIDVVLNDASHTAQAREVVDKVLDNARNGNVSADEFATQVQLRHDRLKSALKPTAAEQAESIAQAIRLNRVYVQPSDELRLFQFHIAHMTEADVNQAMIIHWSQGVEVRSQLIEK